MKIFFVFLIAALLLVVGYGLVLPALDPTWADPQPAVQVSEGESTTITNDGVTCTFYAQAVECKGD